MDAAAVTRRFTHLLTHVATMLPLLSQLLEDECAAPTCPTALQARNRLLLGTIGSMTSSVNMLRGHEQEQVEEEEEEQVEGDLTENGKRMARAMKSLSESLKSTKWFY